MNKLVITQTATVLLDLSEMDGEVGVDPTLWLCRGAYLLAHVYDLNLIFSTPAHQVLMDLEAASQVLSALFRKLRNNKWWFYQTNRGVKDI